MCVPRDPSSVQCLYPHAPVAGQPFSPRLLAVAPRLHVEAECVECWFGATEGPSVVAETESLTAEAESHFHFHEEATAEAESHYHFQAQALSDVEKRCSRARQDSE